MKRNNIFKKSSVLLMILFNNVSCTPKNIDTDVYHVLKDGDKQIVEEHDFELNEKYIELAHVYTCRVCGYSYMDYDYKKKFDHDEILIRGFDVFKEFLDNEIKPFYTKKIYCLGIDEKYFGDYDPIWSHLLYNIDENKSVLDLRFDFHIYVFVEEFGYLYDLDAEIPEGNRNMTFSISGYFYETNGFNIDDLNIYYKKWYKNGYKVLGVTNDELIFKFYLENPFNISREWISEYIKRNIIVL